MTLKTRCLVPFLQLCPIVELSDVLQTKKPAPLPLSDILMANQEYEALAKCKVQCDDCAAESVKLCMIFDHHYQFTKKLLRHC